MQCILDATEHLKGINLEVVINVRALEQAHLKGVVFSMGTNCSLLTVRRYCLAGAGEPTKFSETQICCEQD